MRERTLLPHSCATGRGVVFSLQFLRTRFTVPVLLDTDGSTAGIWTLAFESAASRMVALPGKGGSCRSIKLHLDPATVGDKDALAGRGVCI